MFNNSVVEYLVRMATAVKIGRRSRTQKDISSKRIFALKCQEAEGGARSRGSRDLSVCRGEVFMQLAVNVISLARHIFTMEGKMALSLLTVACSQMGQFLSSC